MRLKAGDIFSIELSEDKIGFGQIIIKSKYDLFIIVFKELYYKSSMPKIDDIPKPVPLLMGYTLDGLLYNELWKVVGNYKENLNSCTLPFYKLGTPPDVFLTNHKSERIREATAQEINALNYQSTLAPIYYEEALKAWHKIVPWEGAFNEILYRTF